MHAESLKQTSKHDCKGSQLGPWHNPAALGVLMLLDNSLGAEAIPSPPLCSEALCEAPDSGPGQQGDIYM